MAAARRFVSSVNEQSALGLGLPGKVSASSAQMEFHIIEDCVSWLASQSLQEPNLLAASSSETQLSQLVSQYERGALAPLSCCQDNTLVSSLLQRMLRHSSQALLPVHVQIKILSIAAMASHNQQLETLQGCLSQVKPEAAGVLARLLLLLHRHIYRQKHPDLALHNTASSLSGLLFPSLPTSASRAAAVRAMSLLICNARHVLPLPRATSSSDHRSDKENTRPAAKSQQGLQVKGQAAASMSAAALQPSMRSNLQAPVQPTASGTTKQQQPSSQRAGGSSKYSQVRSKVEDGVQGVGLAPRRVQPKRPEPVDAVATAPGRPSSTATQQHQPVLGANRQHQQFPAAPAAVVAPTCIVDALIEATVSSMLFGDHEEPSYIAWQTSSHGVAWAAGAAQPQPAAGGGPCPPHLDLAALLASDSEESEGEQPAAGGDAVDAQAGARAPARAAVCPAAAAPLTSQGAPCSASTAQHGGSFSHAATPAEPCAESPQGRSKGSPILQAMQQQMQPEAACSTGIPSSRPVSHHQMQPEAACRTPCSAAAAPSHYTPASPARCSALMFLGRAADQVVFMQRQPGQAWSLLTERARGAAPLLPVGKLGGGELLREKAELKAQLRSLEVGFAQLAGRPLSKEDKDPLRPAYIRYHKINHVIKKQMQQATSRDAASEGVQQGGPQAMSAGSLLVVTGRAQ